MVSKIHRPSQLPGETASDYLFRAIDGLKGEQVGILGQLPSVDALLDYFDLWHAYDAVSWSGVLESITEGSSHYQALLFIRKYKLPDRWTQDVWKAVDLESAERPT